MDEKNNRKETKPRKSGCKISNRWVGLEGAHEKGINKKKSLPT